MPNSLLTCVSAFHLLAFASYLPHYPLATRVAFKVTLSRILTMDESFAFFLVGDSTPRLGPGAPYNVMGRARAPRLAQGPQYNVRWAFGAHQVARGMFGSPFIILKGQTVYGAEHNPFLLSRLRRNCKFQVSHPNRKSIRRNRTCPQGITK